MNCWGTVEVTSLVLAVRFSTVACLHILLYLTHWLCIFRDLSASLDSLPPIDSQPHSHVTSKSLGQLTPGGESIPTLSIDTLETQISSHPLTPLERKKSSSLDNIFNETSSPLVQKCNSDDVSLTNLFSNYEVTCDSPFDTDTPQTIDSPQSSKLKRHKSPLEFELQGGEKTGTPFPNGGFHISNGNLTPTESETKESPQETPRLSSPQSAPTMASPTGKGWLNSLLRSGKGTKDAQKLKHTQSAGPEETERQRKTKSGGTPRENSPRNTQLGKDGGDVVGGKDIRWGTGEEKKWVMAVAAVVVSSEVPAAIVVVAVVVVAAAVVVVVVVQGSRT